MSSSGSQLNPALCPPCFQLNEKPFKSKIARINLSCDVAWRCLHINRNLCSRTWSPQCQPGARCVWKATRWVTGVEWEFVWGDRAARELLLSKASARGKETLWKLVSVLRAAAHQQQHETGAGFGSSLLGCLSGALWGQGKTWLSILSCQTQVLCLF